MLIKNCFFEDNICNGRGQTQNKLNDQYNKNDPISSMLYVRSFDFPLA